MDSGLEFRCIFAERVALFYSYVIFSEHEDSGVEITSAKKQESL